MISFNSFFKKDSKEDLLDNLILFFYRLMKHSDRKTDQRVRLCWKILKKIKTKDYSSKENLDLDKYFFESNKEKQNKQKDVILFTKILAEHILYGK